MSSFLERILWQGLALVLLLAILLIGDWFCYQIALPVSIDVYQDIAALQVGSQTLPLGQVGIPTRLAFAPHDSVVHEYQLDGTDSTNNFTLDTTYLHTLSSSLYYRFQTWMRDLDGTSRWRNAQIWDNGHLQQTVTWPVNGSSLALPATAALHIEVQLQRPETPMTLDLMLHDGSVLHITLDRNDRYIDVTRANANGSNQTIAHVFFPVDALPFAAMVVDFLLRTLLWAVALLIIVFVGETLLGLVVVLWKNVGTEVSRPGSTSNRATGRDELVPTATSTTQRLSLHPIAFVALSASLIFTVWIALVQYHAEPHIFDAAAYLFSAKIYAQGRLWLPIPPASDRFPGPFMVQLDGRWFTQYPPGTGLTLMPGVWLGVPWLVEPVLGTLALLGIGLIASRLYDRRVATIAVVLGTLSPYYSYLAASYMSHAIALFYLVWGTYALLCFLQGKAGWYLPLAAALFGMGILTRDEVALMYVVLTITSLLLLHWRQLRKYWWHWLIPGIAFVGVALIFVGLSLGYNALLTGKLLTTPRSLFFAGDHWGFGQGVGFYGQHTLAAGFVNLDELLTILAIDLFGWPFYFTLAFIALPFLTRRALAVDWLFLGITSIMTGAFIGYFYHGIYLGPRYLFETLPFLLILTARGITILSAIGKAQCLAISERLSKDISSIGHSLGGVVTVLLVLGLIACNLLYYLPRQTEVYHNYAGLPANTPLDVDALYHPPLHNAIVVTNDYVLYQIDLFPLNDPMLHDDVIYAFGSSTADYNELAKAFPTRTLYQLVIHSDGSVTYNIVGA